MKKLFLYIFLFLIWCNVGFAEKIYLKDIKINSNITNYFSPKEIDLYNTEIDGKYGKKRKYSYLYITNPKEKFDENFTLVMIAFENKSWKVQYSAGLFEDLNNCIKFRDDQIKLYKNQLIGYESYEGTSKHDDGVRQEIVVFTKNNIRKKFTCDYYPDSSEYAGTVDFRIDSLTNSFNTWVTSAEGTSTTAN